MHVPFQLIYERCEQHFLPLLLQSERQEYDFMHSNNITTLTAPFGTNDTPNISYKIIASRPVHVIESLQPQRWVGN